MIFKYIAGSNIQSALQVAKSIRKNNKIPVFNYAVENSDNSLSTYKEFETLSNKLIHNDKVAIKLSSFNYDKILIHDLIDIFKDKKIKVIVDAESNEYHTIYKNTVDDLISKYNTNEYCIFKTYQMYRKDSFQDLKEDTVKFQHCKLGTKIVRGAYWNSEHKDGHLFTNKHDTDVNFNNSILYLHKQHNTYNILATHNSRSINLGQSFNLSFNFEFGHLLGMKESKYNQLVSDNQKVNVYIPYGPYKLMIPYLMRRFYENIDTIKYM